MKDQSTLNCKLIRTPIKRRFWLFMLPTLAAFSVGFLYPFFKAFFLSFCKFKTTSSWTFVGFDNYVKIFSDKSFLYSFGFTTVFAIVFLVLTNVFAFLVAYALTRGIKGSNVFRTIFFMPNLIGGIVLGYIWLMIFDGILSHYNTAVVLNTKFGFWGLIILTMWQQVGYMMIIYIAGITSVPDSLLEAAKIDGASSWQSLTKILIPNVLPSVTICTFLTLSNSYKLFDQNLALTNGKPFIQNGDGTVIKTTEMLALNIVNANSATNRGLGQAKAVIFFILVAIIGISQLMVTKKKEVQQ